MRSLLLLLLVLVASAAEVGPSVTLSAAPATVAVGDPVVLTIRYAWEPGWAPASEPDPLPALAPLFVTAVAPVERLDSPAGSQRVFRVTIGAERSGAWTLPAISAAFRGPGGTELTVAAPEVTLQVGTESAPPQLPEPLPPLTRPTAGAEPSHRWWWIAGGTAAAILTVGALWFWRRRATTIAINPHDRCTAALDAALRVADGKAAAAGLGLALRTWSGTLYDFDGAGATVREMAVLLRARPACPADEARTLVRLLERIDEGRWHPGDLPQALVSPLADEARVFVAGVAARLAAAAQAEAKP